MPIIRATRNTVVFKKVYGPERKNLVGFSVEGVQLIAVLRITKGTRIREPSDGFSSRKQRSMKHRASSAKVLRIENMRGEKSEHKVAFSKWSPIFTYRVGRIVRPARGFSPRDVACASGIHFFFTKRQARRWCM